MPEEEHKAASWLGDLTNEWKHAKPPEKALIVFGVIAVGGIAFYLYKKQQGGQSQTITSPAGEKGTAGSSGGSNGGSSAPPANTPPSSGTPPSGTPPPDTGIPPGGGLSTGTGTAGMLPIKPIIHHKHHKHNHNTVTSTAANTTHRRLHTTPIHANKRNKTAERKGNEMGPPIQGQPQNQSMKNQQAHQRRPR